MQEYILTAVVSSNETVTATRIELKYLARRHLQNPPPTFCLPLR
jgi:hypothetical protein